MQRTDDEFSLKDVANEIKKFEALIKKDLQAKERWDVSYFNNHKTALCSTLSFWIFRNSLSGRAIPGSFHSEECWFREYIREDKWAKVQIVC